MNGDNIKINKELECDGVEWIQMVHDIVHWWAVVYTVMYLHI
jgi:hypothetical protein